MNKTYILGQYNIIIIIIIIIMQFFSSIRELKVGGRVGWSLLPPRAVGVAEDRPKFGVFVCHNEAFHLETCAAHSDRVGF